MIDFTNKRVSVEVILRHLVATACQKVKRGLDPVDCARCASEEIIMGILMPMVRDRGVGDEDLRVGDGMSGKPGCSRNVGLDGSPYGGSDS